MRDWSSPWISPGNSVESSSTWLHSWTPFWNPRLKTHNPLQGEVNTAHAQYRVTAPGYKSKMADGARKWRIFKKYIIILFLTSKFYPFHLEYVTYLKVIHYFKVWWRNRLVFLALAWKKGREMRGSRNQRLLKYTKFVTFFLDASLILIIYWVCFNVGHGYIVWHERPAADWNMADQTLCKTKVQ